MTPIHRELDIYGAILHLATDRRGWASLRRLLPTLDKDPDGQGRVDLTLHTADNGKVTPHITIWLDIKATPTESERVGPIAHEATHAATALLDHIGQGYDASSEALAYLVDFIAVWAWEGIGAA